MPYAPHQMLPDDLKAYAAPRPRIGEYVLAVVAFLLALYAWSQPAPTPEPKPAARAPSEATLLCPRWQDGLPLRGALQHCPDGTPDQRWCAHECWYGRTDRRTAL